MICISDMKNEGSASMKNHWLQAIAIIVIPAVISLVLQGGSGFIFESNSVGAIGVIVYIVSIALTLIFSFGTVHYYLKITRGEEGQVSNLFYGFTNITHKVILIQLLLGLFVALWSLLLIVPGIIAGYRYRYALYILRDNPDISILESLKKSSNLVKGYKRKLFLFDLSFIGWGLLCAITLGIAGFYVNPYYSASNAAFYNKLNGLNL